MNKIILQCRYLSVILVLSALCGCKAINDAKIAQANVRELSVDSRFHAKTNHFDFSHYTLSELVDFALTNRPAVQHSYLSLRDEALALKALAATSPLFNSNTNILEAFELQFSGSHSLASKSARLNDLSGRTEGDPSASFSLSVLLYDFGRYNAKYAAQIERIAAAEQDYYAAKYDVFKDVSISYFNFLEKRALLEVAYTNEFEYALHLEQVQARHKYGEAKNLDVLRARLDLAQAKERTVNAKNEVRTTGADLMKSVGLNVDNGSWRNTFDFQINALMTATMAFRESKLTLAEAFSLASTNSPSMRIRKARLRAAIADVDYAKADLKPSLSASTSLSLVDPPLWVWNWGVKGVWTLFQGFGKTTQLERAVVAMEKSAMDVKTAEHDLSRNLEVAISKRNNARESRRTAGQSLRQARKNYEQVRIQYKLGEANRVDFTDAVADFVEALGNRICAFYEGQRAEAEISALLGKFPEYDERKVTEKDL
jgi:outer membrane protein TolC